MSEMSHYLWDQRLGSLEDFGEKESDPNPINIGSESSKWENKKIKKRRISHSLTVMYVCPIVNLKLLIFKFRLTLFIKLYIWKRVSDKKFFFFTNFNEKRFPSPLSSRRPSFEWWYPLVVRILPIVLMLILLLWLSPRVLFGRTVDLYSPSYLTYEL